METIIPTFQTAAKIFPIMRETAKAHGYALAVHGSLVRDIDIIAIPWEERCSDHWTIYAALVASIGGREDYRGWRKRPHNRMARPIEIESTYIDFSVILPCT